MDLTLSPLAQELADEVDAFVREKIEPAEVEIQHFYADLKAKGENSFVVHPKIEELKAEARAAGLWNMFLPVGEGDEWAERFGTRGGKGFSNVDYAAIAEKTGRTALSPMIFNCNAPDTGNMEVLLKYGTREQQEEWLVPLLEGKIRSAFLMTEPAVASSDATNMDARAVIDGDEVVINGRKWWSSGAAHPDCKVFVFMGLSDPDADRHARHSMILVPADAPGVTIKRALPVMGQLDEPFGHCEVELKDVRVPLSNVLAGPGKAFAIAQGRLGPGRIHHCMRLIGLSEMALELACKRGTERVAFGKPLMLLGGNRERLAKARIELDMARLLVQQAAWKLDDGGTQAARVDVSAIKAIVPSIACDIIDFAIQIHGGGGMSDDFPLTAAYANARSLRLADGPDEVHLSMVAREELKPYLAAQGAGAAK
ncbi:acyl-CoA dehydrogenase family protein [Dermacoccus sp. Tok2021]|uniref:acyl-CoA dehydrogenase family protein n=1 Tax=Dermacoccus sp. Tok2021 TaxID=2826873 RepID=UPI001CA6EBEC|nr:acyl-CoA dehydrogenase family protein [Dermacoccus sp. Tok2021]MBZ4497766.1 acyl-CoA dehydrogenase family protein [Dermacoccus sp. Tok2021]